MHRSGNDDSGHGCNGFEPIVVVKVGGSLLDPGCRERVKAAVDYFCRAVAETPGGVLNFRARDDIQGRLGDPGGGINRRCETANGPGRRVLLVFGGGARADKVRDEWGAGKLTDIEAHWAAIRAMSDNGREFGAGLWGLPTAEHRDSAELMGGAVAEAEQPSGALGSRCVVVDAERWLAHEEMLISRAGPSGESRPAWETCLETGWQITSDTIAAWIAARLSAEAIIYLKSCDLPEELETQGGGLSAAINAGVIDAAVAEYRGSVSMYWWNVRCNAAEPIRLSD